MDRKVIKINESQIRKMVSNALKESIDPAARIKQLEDIIIDVGYDLWVLAQGLDYEIKGFEETEDSQLLGKLIDKLDDAVGGRIYGQY